MVIAFFGHSDYIEKRGDKELVLKLISEIADNAKADFYLGDHGGFDKFAYSCAMSFKNIHPDSSLVFISPYAKPSYLNKRSGAFDLTIYPELEEILPRYAICYRNKWTVESADIIISYITHEYGGAYTAYRYALSRKKPVYNIANMR